MAEVQAQLGFVLGSQSALGTINTTIRDLVAGAGSGAGGALDESDGSVLGDPNSGIASSGLAFATARRDVERGVATGSLSKLLTQSLGERIETLTLAWVLKGNGATVTPVDAEFELAAGIKALLAAAGLGGAAWGSGVGFLYTPQAATTAPATLKLWDSGESWVFQDVIASSVEIDFTPGEVVVATANLAGTVAQYAAETFPTFDYGGQETVDAPIVGDGSGAGHFWGIADAPRDFTEASLTIANDVEERPGSNAPGGLRSRQTGRTVTLEATILADDGDVTFERDQIVESVDTNLESLEFEVGAAAGAAETARGFKVILPKPEARVRESTVEGTSAARVMELRAVTDSSSPDAELELILH